MSSRHLPNSLTTVCLCGIKSEGANPPTGDAVKPLGVEESGADDAEETMEPRQRKAWERASIEGDA